MDESPELIEMREAIAAEFAAVDNARGEPPTHDQINNAHLAACVVLELFDVRRKEL